MPSDAAGTPHRTARGPGPCTRRTPGYPGGASGAAPDGRGPPVHETEEENVTSTAETGRVTGTADQDYNLI